MAGLTILERAKFPTQKVPGMRVQIVERASDEFPFLHDTMIAPLGGRLFMAWYSCTAEGGRRTTAGRGAPRRFSARMPKAGTWFP